MTYRLTALPAGETVQRRDELLALFAQAFCGAPWHEPPLGAVRSVERLLGTAARNDDFTAVAALDTDGALLGIAAGWTDTVLSAGAPAFEVAELVVAPGHQGRRIGRGLHDALLAAAAPGPALLMTLDVPELTDRYARWGWTVVDRRRPGQEEREYVVMSREG